MRFWSIISLIMFLNFTALPCIAAIAGWDIPQNNVIANEEETHSSAYVIVEKTIPKTLDINEFLKFYKNDLLKKAFVKKKSDPYFSPHLSIFSPPPEA